MISRRAFLGLGVAGAVAAVAAISGEVLLDRSTELVLPRFAHATPGPLVHGSYYSRARHRRVGWTVSYPQGHLADARIPVCLVLHGYDSNNRYAFDELNMQLAQAQLIEGNPIRPIALASIDGGNTYWHPRSDGDDPIKMVFEEYLPMLERRGLDTSRIGVLGWSMGGYGALLFGELHPQIVAVVALSPAIWPSYATAHNVDLGAFDSDADWQRNNVIAHIASLPTGAVRVDCGRSDPFLPASQALDKLLQPPDAVALSPGGHDATFWANATPSAIRFLGSHLG